MSIILGVGMLGHDNGACLVKDGRIVVAVEEERFSRVKHEEGFPEKSIQFCLDYANVTINDVDYVARSFLPGLIHKKLSHIIPRLKMEAYPNALYFEHHLCHAASTYYTSGFNKSKVITYDGMGESNSTVAWDANGDSITKIHEKSKDNSLGHVYTFASLYMGFGHFGAGIVMGLSGYGEYDDTLNSRVNKYLLNPSEGRWYTAKNDMYTKGTDVRMENINSLTIGINPVSNNNPNGIFVLNDPIKPYSDFAYLIQRKLEESLVNIVQDVSTKGDNLCLSGGCALNCNANTLAKTYVKDLSIFAAANDGGTSVGAALLGAMLAGDKVRHKISDVYLGPDYSNDSIEDVLKSSGLKFEECSDISGVCGELISTGKIVGWFQGRMELGPRALGNRSILADPRTVEVRDRVNKIKKRLWWRPLAPSMLEDRRDEYLEDSFESPYMLHTFKVREDKRGEVKAITHVDYSTRPQTVRKKQNERLYNLIKSFEDETNVPMVINTSFNVQEPIVCSPMDAVRAFKSSDLDYLAIGDYLCRKN